MKREEKFIEGSFFHIFNKSIANYGIFKDENNNLQFLKILEYYNNVSVKTSFSDYLNKKGNYQYNNLLFPKENPVVKFFSYCQMPDHYHLLLKIISGNLSNYIGRVENSYTRFFNLRFKRKGPLWQSQFKAVKIKSNEQLLHVLRYINLNPTTNGLVDCPEDWKFSSYKDLITDKKILKEYLKEISIDNIKKFKQFVEDQKDYQQKLKSIKKLVLE